MAPPLLLRHRSSREHDTGTHPERPARIVAVERALAERDWLGWDVRESPAAEREVVCAVHPEAYVNSVAAVSAAGGGALDADTVMSEDSYRAALHAAGGAAALVDALLDGDGPRVGASLHRPPGHHALPTRAMGFCLFNNVAVAARRALDRWGAERVLILDWDVHHGNGTNDIFHRDPTVLYVSIHESPLYPGTGPAGDAGSGPGEGYTVNLPVPAGSGDAVWCSLVEHVAMPLGLEYKPGIVLISAGFDAHARDPLGQMRVTERGFAAMCSGLRDIADAACGGKLVLLLEGGYDLRALRDSTRACLEVMTGGKDEFPSGSQHARAAVAATRSALSQHWPLP